MVTNPSLRKINRTNFYKVIKTFFFNGKISQLQVDGITTILDEWESRGYSDIRWLAYILATIMHETASTFQPIAEYGKGKGYKYGVPDPITHKIYYGRGFSQITWKWNYEQFSKLLKVDLVNNPDLALDCKIATDIIFEGMVHGLFTGKKLSDYFTDKIVVNHEEAEKAWINARKIINGLDKASLIAGYAKKFFTALN